MTDSDTYVAELRDRPFGPVIERVLELPLIDHRPDQVLRRYAEHDGRRWIKVYDLEAEYREGLEENRFSYQLSYEGPEDITLTDDEEMT